MGGWYELVNKTTFLPNPDYWIVFLFHHLAKSGGYSVTSSSPALRAYSQCYAEGGALLELSNLSPSESVEVDVTWPQASTANPLRMWVISADGPSPATNRIKVNGKSLEWNPSDGVPSLSLFTPVPYRHGVPVTVPPASIVFLANPNGNHACPA